MHKEAIINANKMTEILLLLPFGGPYPGGGDERRREQEGWAGAGGRKVRSWSLPSPWQ